MSFATPADSWTREVASLPLAFAQVREDPRLDLAVLERLKKPADVVMIASGGDTAVCLAREPLRSLTLVDVNPAQLALCRVKLHLASNKAGINRVAWLGHEEMAPEERAHEWLGLSTRLEMSEDALGPPEVIGQLGADHAGRYERLFAKLREELSSQQHTMQAILRFAQTVRPNALRETHPEFKDALRSAMTTVMALPNLVALFGGEATQNPRQSFHSHFTERVLSAFEALPPVQNPFLWQMLSGTFPPSVTYDWMESDTPPLIGPRYEQGKMGDVLATMPSDSADFVHLSNILDWLNKDAATTCLIQVARVLRPGGAVLLRQLNSTLLIPELRSGLRWDGNLSAQLHAQDRSFFYHAIHVGFRP